MTPPTLLERDFSTAIVEGVNVAFSNRKKRTLQDADFGSVFQQNRGSWKGTLSELWGSADVQLLLDADENGPSDEQKKLIRNLRANVGDIRDRIEAAIRKRIESTKDLMASPRNAIKLSTIFFPLSLPTGTWRLWYDLEGEDVYWFGAEIIPTGEILAFVED